MIVVTALRSSWFIVKDTDELIGRLREASRLPQYLMTATAVSQVSWKPETPGHPSAKTSVALYTHC